jgi:hypothetical protein
MPTETMGGRAPSVFVGCVVAAFILTTLALGSWWGFPVQDDNYMIRLLRRGGPDRIIRDQPERPICAALIAGSARVAGEHRERYILVGLVLWSAFSAVSVRFWRLLFPEWAQAWPAIALAVVAPVLAVVQFTTVTTLYQCLVPVILLLAALVVLLGRSDCGAQWKPRLGVVLLAAAGAALSEYGLAAGGAAAVFLLMRRRWRGTLTLLAGGIAGYAIFRAMSDVHVRKATNPALQIQRLLSRPWPHPFSILTAAWYSVVGAWGRAVSEIRVEWSSKSTILGVLVALLVAGTATALFRHRREGVPGEGIGGRVLALLAAVVAGLAPAVIIQAWPLRLVYETRFTLPVVVFASCATAAILLAVARPELRALAVFALSFVAADRLIVQAFEEKRLQQNLEALGDRVLPFVRQTDGLVVLVSPDRTGQSAVEAMAKATYRWNLSDSDRFWMIRPEDLDPGFQSRTGCPDLRSVRLPPQYLGWPRATDDIAQLLWDPAERSGWSPVPYFPGCFSR